MQHSINFGTGFQQFNGWQYLCIDAANHFGMDKELFETRIQFIEDNIDNLDLLADKAEEPELFRKAAMVIDRARRGLAVGHIVHFDACCSG